VLTAEVDTVERFEAILAESATKQNKPQREIAQATANWFVNVVMGAVNQFPEYVDAAYRPSANSALLTMISAGTLSSSLSKEVYTRYVGGGGSVSPEMIVEQEGLVQTSDTGAIDAAVDKVLAANADKVAEYKAGKQALFGFFVGQTMKAMAGKANPQVVNERLRAKLGG
jgi:aspartyl-tRNA(Asn)/glutamyl-tRNA(Gln) amidotransferase subunit B